MLRMCLALLLTLAASVGPAAAEEIDLGKLLSNDWGDTASRHNEEADAEAKDQLSAAYCDRYGPGYELVPGTTTCIRASGYVQMDVYTRGRR